MAATVTDDQWRTARAALADAAERFAGLLRDVPEPLTTMATADWSVSTTAAHVVTIAWLYRSIVTTGEPPEEQLPGITEHILATTVDTVDDINVWVLARYTERDSTVLAGRLSEEIAQVLRATGGRDPAETVSWLGGARVPLAGLLAHMANELVLHGYDVARATGLRFAVPAQVGALFFELLVVGAVRNGQGVLLDGGPRTGAGRPIAVEFRSAYTAPVTLVVHDGVVTAHDPGGPVDARVTFDPAVLTLMVFGRVSKVRAVLRGGVRIGGPRPWRLRRFLRMLRVPDVHRTGRHPRAGEANLGQSLAA
jgi:hypothetical protein